MTSTVHSQVSPVNNSLVHEIVIRVPAATEWKPKRVQQFMLGIFSLPIPIALRLVVAQHHMEWQLNVPRFQVEAITKTIYAFYPEAHITTKPKQAADISYYVYQLHGAAPFIAPIKHAEEFNELDPLTSILSALTDLYPGEQCIYELALKPITEKHYELGEKMITDSLVKWWHFLKPSWAVTAVTYKVMGWDKVERFRPEIQKVAEAKLNGQLKQATLSLKIRAQRKGRADYLFSLLEPGLAAFERVGFNFLVPAQPHSFPLVLSPAETAALWHFPTQDCRVPGIQWAPGIVSPPAAELTQQEDGVLLGMNYYQGRRQEVRLAYADRVTHVNLIGKTRVGKSTLLYQMAQQDIQTGKGVAVIDPHGDLVEQLLASSIPREREQDVVLLDVADRDHVIGLNLLASPPGVPREVAASQALSVIRKLFADQWSATRMEDALYAVLVSLISTGEATLQDIPRLFSDQLFRQHVLLQVNDSVTLEFWRQEYEPLSESHKREIARPVNTRIRKFYRNETIRRIVCQPNCLDFRAIMDDGKIFLANLRGTTGIEGETLGALLISKIQMAAMSRASDSPSRREPYFLYIDEAQNFVTTSLPAMFSEAGKYGLSLVLANQFLGQLTGETLEAVLGNVGTMIMFRVGPRDAQSLHPFVKPNFSGEDLFNLNRFNAVVKMQHAGQTLPAFSMQTQPPRPKPQDAPERVERIRAISRDKYTLPKEVVDEAINKRFQDIVYHTPSKPETKVREVNYFD